VVVSPNGLTSAESLKLKLGTLPELTFEMVPKKMGDIARTISKSQQVSPSMAILACIATVNAAVAGKYQVAPVTKNWTEEFSSLYVAIIAESGGRKSTVFKKVTDPIEGWEQKKRKELLPVYIEAQQKVKAKRKALKDLQDQAYPEPAEEPESDPEDEDEVGEVKGDPVAKEELSTGHAQEELQAALAAVPVLPDLLVNDATPEALEVRCADHEGRVAIFDPEGGPLKNITGKRWKTPPSFELMKKAFSGEKHRSDRIGRGTTEVHQPAITVLLMTQPSLMTEMAKNKSMRGEGLWNRFLFLYLPSNKANLKPSHKAPALNKEVTDEWNKSVCRLLDANHKGTTPHLSPNGDKVQQVPILHDLPHASSNCSTQSSPSASSRLLGREDRGRR
jgi:replicative DNA helicase